MAWLKVLAFLALAQGALGKGSAEPLTFEVAEDRKERELQVVRADRQIEALEDQRYASTVKELTSARRAVENEAAASAEEALAAQEHVEELEMQQQVLLAKAKDFGAQQKEQVKYAEDSTKRLEQQLEEAKAFAKTADQSVKDLARGAVAELFTSKGRQLDAWRSALASDPYALGRRGALAAVRPYRRAMGVAEERAGSYDAAAESLRRVAQGLARAADRATLTAAAQRMAGEGGLRLARAAQQMRSHLRQLKGYAKDLQQSAEELSAKAPRYLASAQSAAQRAEWEANLEALPPRPAGFYVPP